MYIYLSIINKWQKYNLAFLKKWSIGKEKICYILYATHIQYLYTIYIEREFEVVIFWRYFFVLFLWRHLIDKKSMDYRRGHRRPPADHDAGRAMDGGDPRTPMAWQHRDTISYESSAQRTPNSSRYRYKQIWVLDFMKPVLKKLEYHRWGLMNLWQGILKLRSWIWTRHIHYV